MIKKRYRPRLNKKQNEVVKYLKGDSKIKTYLALGCMHVPFHNEKILNNLFTLMDTYSFDGIIIGGDFLDMGALSYYERGKINKLDITLEEEYEVANIILDEFDKKLNKNSLKVFLFGNHENRYYKWLADVNHSKYGDLINPTQALNLEGRGYEVYEDYKNDYYCLGELYIFHGEFYNIHVSKRVLDTWKVNSLFWHTHRMQMYREGELCAYNAGFLGDIESMAFDYASKSQKIKWANGFSLIHIDENDDFFVELINCTNGSFIYNGVLYNK